MLPLAFDPLTGALTAFAVQNALRTRPGRVIPHARVILRRHSDIFVDAAVTELSDAMMDFINPQATAVSAMMVGLVLVLLWRRLATPPDKKLH